MTAKVKSKRNADDYAYEALAAKMDGTIRYDDKNDNLIMWLDKYQPSKVSRLDRIGWIVMQSDEHPEEEDTDFDKLQDDWTELQVSGNPVNFESICELAKRHGVLKGAWLFHVKTGDKVDILWRKVAMEFAGGCLTGVATKVSVSPNDPSTDNYVHVIMVKHADFTDEAGVYRLHEALRCAGVKTRLSYKPKIYSRLGIYRNNEHMIRPTIYQSQYDALKKVCKITHLYEEEPFESGPDLKRSDPVTCSDGNI